MAGLPRAIPTVVVARRPAPGKERQFERWQRRLDAAARRAPGFLESQLQAPDDVHPDEWVIVYRFATPADLQGWLSSPARERMMAMGADLVVGPGREQVIALASDADPVTAVASFHVRDGHADEFDVFQARLAEAVSRFPGFLRVERFDPVHGVQREVVVVFAFDTREHLDAWMDSPERTELLEAARPHLDDLVLNVLGGFAGWFDLAGRSVKRWKQALVVWLAIAPTTLVLTELRRRALPDLHWVPGALLTSAVSVSLLTWVLMPRLTALLGRWLRR